MINIAIIGLGHWGPNLLRNFNALDECKVISVCDKNHQRLEEFKELYPQLEFTTDYQKLLHDNSIDAIVVSTPAAFHYEIGKKVLAAGKHVFIEKPLALEVSHGEELIKIAQEKGLKLMVGHLLLYHPAIEKLRLEIGKGTIGKIYHLYFRRTGLGRIYERENVLWNLTCHDLYLALYFLEKFPVAVSSQGGSYLQEGIEEVVFTSLTFKEGEIAHFHASALDPFIDRRVVVVGELGMLVFDEMEKSLKLYRKKIAKRDAKFDYIDEGAELIEYSDHMPLERECQHFLDAIKENKKPISDGENGLEVLKILSFAQKSLQDKGATLLF